MYLSTLSYLLDLLLSVLYLLALSYLFLAKLPHNRPITPPARPPHSHITVTRLQPTCTWPPRTTPAQPCSRVTVARLHETPRTTPKTALPKLLLLRYRTARIYNASHVRSIVNTRYSIGYKFSGKSVLFTLPILHSISVPFHYQFLDYQMTRAIILLLLVKNTLFCIKKARDEKPYLFSISIVINTLFSIPYSL